MTETAKGGGWSLLDSETLCDSPFLKVCREHVTTPSRPQGVHWMVARRREATVIAPQTQAGDFLMIRQERVPIRQEIWEFPAGQIDDGVSEESIRQTALRELEEEAGVECRGALQPLGFFYSSAGFTDEKCHLFLASDVVALPRMGKRDEDEAILEVKAFSPETLRGMVADGKIQDANSLAVFARLAARKLI